MDPTCGLVDKFRDLALNLIWEQLLYLIYHHRNIDQLNGQLTELNLERIAIQHQIDEAKNNGEQIEEKVLRWLGEVDALSEQVQKFHEEESQARTECSITSCPNPWLCYKLSKRAKAMTEEGAKIFAKRNLGRIGYLPPLPSNLELTNTKGNEGIDSRIPIMNQILEELKNPGVTMIGLCGLGGVGKTTIAKEVAKNQKIFEKVIMATVSQEMNIGHIQDQIIDKLGMQLNEKTEEGKASRLYERLKEQKNMLLILDDLWQELDLGKVGIPFGSVENDCKKNEGIVGIPFVSVENDSKKNEGKVGIPVVSVENDSKKSEGCKILLTSRKKELLSDLMKCQKIVEVGVLSKDEALGLFIKIAELSSDSSTRELTSRATDIVQKCGGLPLAIATAAKTLRNKDLKEFEDALARLNNPLRRNNTLTREVDRILTFSYDRLGSLEYKHIFLLAAMLSHDPSIEDLIMYSVGLDVLDGIQSMEEAHAGVSTAVRKLKSSNLFLDSISSHHVTIHDVFRDVAWRIAFDELHALIRRRLREWPDKNMLQGCKGICLQESDISDLPEELHGPGLMFFLLNSTRRDLNIPSMFFKSSKELKVLAITNVHFSSLPLLVFLQTLKALCLHSCLLEDITEIRSLGKLKILSLAYSEIERLPIELAELTFLQMLNLSHCSNLKEIPQKLLSSLKKLEVLYMGNSFHQWKVEGSSEANENPSLDELKDLPIYSLDIQIPNISMLSENLFLKMNLRRYRIFIGKSWEWQGNYGTSKILKLELENSIDWMAQLQNLVKGVQDLHLYGSNGQENVLNNLDVSGFPCLRHLHIESNDDIKYIVMNSAHHEDAFPILQSLELKNLEALENLCEGLNDVVFRELHTLKMENLPALTGYFSIKDRTTKNASNKIFQSLFNEKVLFPKLEILELSNLNSSIALIWDNPLSNNSLCNLKTLKVEECSFVILVPLHVLKSLKNLEEIEVQDCNKLEIVFDFEDLKDEKEMESSSVVVPLKKLKLWDLPKLKNVWSNHRQGIVSFPSQRSVVVYKCGFVKLVPLHVLKSLKNLEEIEVRDCNMLEIVFDFEDLKDEKEMESSSVVVPLKKLKLWDLPKLKNVWSNHRQRIVSFPSLRSVVVYKCGFVKLVALHVLKSLKNLEEIEVMDCNMLEIVFDFEDLKDEKEMESSSVVVLLKKLKLWHLPKLKNVWSNHRQRIVSFPSLRSVVVYQCGFVKLVALHVLKSLKNLEEIEVRDCNMLEIVFDFEDLKDENEMESSSVVVPLKKLKLWHLPKLKNVWSNHHQGNVSFPSLRSVGVYKCESLTSIFPASIAKGMLCDLEEFEIDQCGIDVIVAKDQVLESAAVTFELPSLTSLDRFNLKKLKMLKLLNLPKLKNVCSNNCQGNWHAVTADLCIKDGGTKNASNEISKSLFNKVLFSKLEILELSNLNSSIALIWDDQLSHNSLCNLKTLKVKECGFVKLVPLHVLKSLKNLEEIEVRDCNMLEIVFDFEDLKDEKEMESSSVVVPLKKLKLWHLPKLKNVWSNHHQGNVSFPSLRSVDVYKCESLTSIFPASIAKGMLCDLEELEIDQCGIDVIVAKDQVLESAAVTFEFPSLTSLDLFNLKKLKMLKLLNLPKLKNVCSNNCQGNWHAVTADLCIKDGGTKNASNEISKSLFNKVLFSKLEILELSNLNSLIALIWDDQLSHNSLCNLKTLKVEECGFVKLVSLHVLKSLKNLEEIEVRDCNMLEIVFDFEDLKDEKEMESSSVVVPLKKLKLWHLPKLKNVWSNHHQGNVSFPSLRSVDVYKCESLTSIFPASIAKGKLCDLEELEIDQCGIDVIVAKDQVLESAAVTFGFPSLTSLDLFNLKKLKMLKLLNLPKLKNVCSNNCQGNWHAVTADLCIKDGGTKNASNEISKSLFNKVFFPKLEILELSYLNSSNALIWVYQLLHNSFINLKTLIVKRYGFVKLVPLHVLKSLKNLEEIEVRDCDMLEIVFDFEDLKDEKEMESSSVVVPLKKLKLWDLPKLKNVWSNHHQGNVSFPSLRSVDVYKCESLTSIFPASIAKGMLCDLEELEIDQCGIDVIVAKDQVLESAAVTFEFPSLTSLDLFNLKKLKMLKLLNLPKLKNVCSDNCQGNWHAVTADLCIKDGGTKNASNEISKSLFNKVLFPKLEILELSYLNCSNALIRVDQLSRNSFINLKTLIVKRYGFVKLVPLHVLKSLKNLEEIEVQDCNMLEIVFDFEDLKDEKEMESSSVVVPLKKLKLWDLPKLKNVWSNHHQGTVSFPSLRSVDVYKCESLTSIFPASIAKGMLCDLEELEIDQCGIDVIVAKDQVLESAAVTFEFPSLTSLDLFNLKKLKMLKLLNLPKLKNVCSNNCQGNWHAVTADLCIKDGGTKNASNEISKSLFNKVLCPKLEILELSNLNSSIALIWDDQLSHNSLCSLKTLKVEECRFVKLVPLHVLKSLKNLEEIEVRDCNMLEIVFDFEDLKDEKEMESSSVVVPLKKLKLWDLPKLKNVWSNHHQGNVSFPSLRSVDVYKCESLTSIFPASIAKGMLCDLEELEIDQCGIDVIVAKDQVLESAAVTFEFPSLTSLDLFNLKKLKMLKLLNLPKLKNVCSNNCQGNWHAVAADLCIKDGGTKNASNEISKSLFNKVLFPMLEILELSNLNSSIALIWDDQLSHNSLCNLKTLKVKECGFVKLVPLHVLKSLKNLEEIEVRDCNMLEIVFDFEDLKDEKEMESSSVVVPLKKLKLWHLPKLKNVWSNHHQGNVSFPSLRSVDVYKCESLTSIFPASIAKGMLCDLEELEIDQCGIDVIKDQVLESAAVTFEFPSLTSLDLFNLKKLKMLKLLNLPKLKNVCSNNCQGNWHAVAADLCIKDGGTKNASNEISKSLFNKVLFPMLEILELSNLNSSIALIWEDQLSHNSLCNLKTLKVKECGFVKLVPLHVLKSLKNLEEIEVRDCNMLEIVFDFEDLKDEKEMESSSVVVPLKKLKLWHLPKLKNVWSNHHQGNVSFPSLRSVDVYKCESLTSIFPATIAKGMLCDLEELEIDQCGIDVIKDQVLESAAVTFEFPSLTSLDLFNLKKLKMLKLLNLPKLKNVCSNNCQGNWHAVTADLCIRDGGTKNASNEISKSLFNKVLFPKLEILELSNLNSSIALIWEDQLSHNSLCNLKTLKVEECGFVKLVPLHVLKSLKNLEEIVVRDCNMLEMVFDFEELKDEKEMESSSVVVPLKKLKLWDLPKLKNVWSNHHQGNVSFPSLRSVDVYKCESLTSIFPASIAKGMLCDLEELEIDQCGIDVIVAMDQVLESAAVTFEFPSLTSLYLSDLQKLRNFFPHQHTLKLPQLHWLSIERCDELEIFEKEISSSSEIHEEESTLNSKYPLFSHHDKVIQELEELTLRGKGAEKIGSGQFPIYHFPNIKFLSLYAEEATTISYRSLMKSFTKLEDLQLSGNFEKAFEREDVARFPKLTLSINSIMGSLSPSLVSSPNLTHLNVKGCNEWTTLMTSSIAQSLVHITHLSISNCDQFEEIITKQEGEDDQDKEIFFYKMKFLELDDLPRLKRFCGYNYTFRFPLLKHVTITECPRLTAFCPGAIHAPQLQSIGVDKYDPHNDIWMTNLNNTIQHLFTFEKVISTTHSMAINAKNITRIVDVFPNVSSLYVECFTDEGVTFPYSSLERFPQLDELYVEHCSFEEIFPSQDQIIDFMGKISPFKDLWRLSLFGCHQLIHLVTTSTAKSLVSFRQLEINDCKKMEEIVMNDINENVESGITFNQLQKIKLTDMPRLKMFSSQSHTFKFPDLEKIKITGCPELKMFCQGVLETPKLSKVKIEEHDMEWKDGDLNKTLEILSSAN